MIIPKTVPILEDIDDCDDDVQVSLSIDGEVESIKYSGHGYGYSETARVYVQNRFQEPAVGYPYSRADWEATKHFRNGEGRGTTFRALKLKREQEEAVRKQALLEEEKDRKEKRRQEEEAWLAREAVYLKSFRNCLGVRDSPVESLILKATYRRTLVGSAGSPKFAGQNLWGFADPRSFKFLLKEDAYTVLSDFVRLPPEKHEKLRKLCYDGDVSVSRDVWCEITIDGEKWRYDIRLEFRQLEDRVEQLSEFYVVEEIGIAAIVK